MKTRVYLDSCCFGRQFDGQDNSNVRLETDAIAQVQQEVEKGNIELAWSFVLEHEDANNPHEERRETIAPWKKLAVAGIEIDAGVFRHGLAIEQQGIHSMDALHIACAIKARCHYFLTTDKKVLNKRIDGIAIRNPVDFIQEMEAGK